MKSIADKSIDAIICDLPYGITDCKWDTVIPFEPLWEQYKRIIKPNGAIVLFGSQPFTSALVMSNPKWFKYEWIWEKEKGTGFGVSGKRPLKKHENILIFFNKASHFCSQGEKLKKAYTRTLPIKSSLSGGITSKNLTKDGERIFKTYNFKTKQSVIKFARDNGNRGIHPTQKPVALLEYLVRTYTQEGELILDNTAGSGSLAIAAINTNRQYICIEKDDHYFEVMKDRIANHDPNAPKKQPKAKTKPLPKGQLAFW